MSPEELTQLVDHRFKRSILPEAKIFNDDATRIEEYFRCTLPEGFAAMRAFIGLYQIEGDHLPAAGVIATFEAEKGVNPQWSDDLIPFYSIGNGDFLCLRRSECPTSCVYFVPHDEPRVSKIHDSFDEYLRDACWFN